MLLDLVPTGNQCAETCYVFPDSYLCLTHQWGIIGR